MRPSKARRIKAKREGVPTPMRNPHTFGKHAVSTARKLDRRFENVSRREEAS